MPMPDVGALRSAGSPRPYEATSRINRRQIRNNTDAKARGASHHANFVAS